MLRSAEDLRILGDSFALSQGGATEWDPASPAMLAVVVRLPFP